MEEALSTGFRYLDKPNNYIINELDDSCEPTLFKGVFSVVTKLFHKTIKSAFSQLLKPIRSPKPLNNCWTNVSFRLRTKFKKVTK